MLLLFTLYQLSQLFVLPFIAVYLIVRKIKGKPAFGKLTERIGLVPETNEQKNTIWFHAVSVGEVLSLQSIIERVKERTPNTSCYLTVGTLAGKKVATEKLKADVVSFLPYDFLPCMLVAYKRIKPKTIIIVEAEIWPNLIMLAHFKNIPMYLINARISKRSKARYHTLKIFLLPLFNAFKKIYTQSELDKHEFEQFGINENKLKALGNVKAFNVLEKQKKEAIQPAQLSPTLLVGSLHPGELDVYLNLYKKLKHSYPDLTLILAPRHFHWKKELISKIKSTGYDFVVWDDETPYAPRGEDILLVCKLGELFTLYPKATIYFLGGTFVPIGGHNLLEPAVWGIPTIVGPHHHNCQVIAKELVDKDGLITVTNEQELFEETKRLLEHQEKRDLLGNNSRVWLENESKKVEERLKELF